MKIKYSLIVPILSVLVLIISSCSKENLSNEAPSSGKGGSLARFTISGNYLYTVSRQDLTVYDISDPGNPIWVAKTSIGWDIETIYPYKDKLFIGSMEAMYIYSLDNPASPTLEGTASHVRSCDPVVAKDSFAYVTLRTNSSCQGIINALMVYDVRNISMPAQINQIELKHPYGLGIGESALYVCDDNDGLKVFDLTDPVTPALRKTLTGYNFRDCIPYGDILICMIADGMVIYDISDELNPVFIIKL